MILRVQDLRKTYRQGQTAIEVLQGVSLEVGEGETVAILGKSGSGKSTLLSLLAGLDYPTSGSVILNGTDISKMKEEELAGFRGRNLGIVFQQFHLMSNLTAIENVMLPLQLNLKETMDLVRAQSTLESVGLGFRLNHMPHQLSGGEKQRVAIARALIASPKLLLADEPSGSLDDETGTQVMNLLFESVRTLKMSMILVTHNQELANLCSRKLVLERGVLK